MLSVDGALLPLLGEPMKRVAAFAALPSAHEVYVGVKAVTWRYQSLGLEVSFGREDRRLETIFLHGPGHEGFPECQVLLPLGLGIDNAPADVRAKLGKPTVTGGGRESGLPYDPVPPWSIYRYRTYVHHVQYSPARDRIELVTVMRPDVASAVGTTR